MDFDDKRYFTDIRGDYELQAFRRLCSRPRVFSIKLKSFLLHTIFFPIFNIYEHIL